jgi:hypothetical protein
MISLFEILFYLFTIIGGFILLMMALTIDQFEMRDWWYEKNYGISLRRLKLK